MTLQQAIGEVRRIAKRCGYAGDLTERALRECAEVYLSLCNADGMPRPRLYMRSGGRHERTRLDEMRWLLTRTPRFRAWFGKSVVVDGNGDPKVMYHGSWSDFGKFKPSAIGMEKSLMTLWSGPGFYFSDRPETARIYAGGEKGRVYRAFLRLERPLVVDETGNAEKEPISRGRAVELFLSGDNTQWLDAGLSAELARMDDAEGKRGGGRFRYRRMSRRERVEEFVRRLKTDVVKLKTAAQAFGARSQRKFLEAVCRVTGHDGVIHTLAPEVVEYVVYDPAAVKSADENDGEYSPKSEAAADAAEAADAAAHGGVSGKSEKEGDTEMKGLQSVVDALKALAGRGTEAMDIVDAKGRHHQPKAIPEGGEYESEGKYAATAKAREEWFHKTFAENNKPQMKKMRDFCAEILSHVDASKMGNDTAVTGFKTQVHKYADMPKKAVVAGMKSAWDAMKRHADTYNEVKGMGKEEFADWLNGHQEYASAQVKALMGNKAYGKKFMMKNEKGEYVEQDHEAWEEAKMVIGRMAVGSLVDYMAHTEALRNTPDALIDKFLEGKGGAEKHKGGAEAYAKEHGVKHGEGETAKGVTMSEINAVESELSKAIEDAKTDDAEAAEKKTMYYHALSHFLGKDGGLRDPEATKESVVTRAVKRLAEKFEAYKKSDDKDSAYRDGVETTNAANVLVKTLYGEGADIKDFFHYDESNNIVPGGPGFGKGGAEKPGEAKGAGAGGAEKQDGGEEPKGGDEPKGGEGKPGDGGGKATLNAAGAKFRDDIKAFLDKETSKKYVASIDKWLTGEEKSAHQKVIDGNGIAANRGLHKELLAESQKLQKAGDKAGARKAMAKYFMTVQRLYDQLEAVGK